jgi:hypothetical protein
MHRLCIAYASLMGKSERGRTSIGARVRESKKKEEHTT